MADGCKTNILTKPYFFIGFFLIIYLVCALLFIHKPLTGDEFVFAFDAQQVHFGKIGTWHPPFYFDSLRLCHFLFGFTGENLRFFNIFCFTLTLFLVYPIAEEIFSRDENNKSGKTFWLFTIFMYAVHPMALQGSLVLDIDNSLLNLLLLLFIFVFLKSHNQPGNKNLILLGFFLFFCLWTKLSTSFGLILVIFIFQILSKGVKRGIGASFLIAGVGIGILCAAWALYANFYKIPVFALAERISQPIQATFFIASHYFLRDFLKRTIRIILWINPFIILLFLRTFGIRLKEFSARKIIQPIDFCFIYVIVIFTGYLFVGGGAWSFPKYHFPLLAILILLVFGRIGKADFNLIGKEAGFYIGMIVVMIFYNVFIVGDLLYLLNYKIRNAFILAPQDLPVLYKDFFRQLFLYVLPIFIITAILKIIFAGRYKLARVIYIGFIIAAISTILSGDFIHLKADYATSFCYGRSTADMRKLEGFFLRLKHDYPKSMIIGPGDVLFNAGLWNLGMERYVYCTSGENFLSAIKDERVICVAYGVSWNDIFQYRNIFYNRLVQGYLKQNYRAGQMGEYTIWLRRSIRPEDYYGSRKHV